jgi:hypothetical protein
MAGPEISYSVVTHLVKMNSALNLASARKSAADHQLLV